MFSFGNAELFDQVKTTSRAIETPTWLSDHEKGNYSGAGQNATLGNALPVSRARFAWGDRRCAMAAPGQASSCYIEPAFSAPAIVDQYPGRYRQAKFPYKEVVDALNEGPTA